MITLRRNIFRIGGAFVASILFYYSFVCDSWWVGGVFFFYGLATLGLTFNDELELNI